MNVMRQSVELHNRRHKSYSAISTKVSRMFAGTTEGSDSRQCFTRPALARDWLVDMKSMSA